MFNELYDTYSPKDVVFYAVSASPFGRNYSSTDRTRITMEDLTWFRDTYGVKFPLLFDGDVKSADDYRILYYPTVYVIGKNGTVSAQLVGETGKPLTKERIAAAIDAALK